MMQMQTSDLNWNDNTLRCDLCKIAVVMNQFPDGERKTLYGDLLRLADKTGWTVINFEDHPLHICPICQAVASALRIAEGPARSQVRCPTCGLPKDVHDDNQRRYCEGVKPWEPV